VRSSEWLKLKRQRTADVVVVGVTKGKGRRRATFGALILAKRDRRGRLRYVGKTSGFSESEMRTLLGRLKKAKRPPIGEPVSDVKYWVKPEVVVEVKYLEETPDGKLRQPSFLRIREDKTP
jgi:ATP-dependent DNA ligase